MITDEQIREKWKEVIYQTPRPPEGIDGALVIEVVRWALNYRISLQERDFYAWLQGLQGKMCVPGRILFTACEYYKTTLSNESSKQRRTDGEENIRDADRIDRNCEHQRGWRTIVCNGDKDVCECPICGKQRVMRCNFDEEYA